MVGCAMRVRLWGNGLMTYGGWSWAGRSTQFKDTLGVEVRQLCACACMCPACPACTHHGSTFSGVARLPNAGVAPGSCAPGTHPRPDDHFRQRFTSYCGQAAATVLPRCAPSPKRRKLSSRVPCTAATRRASLPASRPLASFRSHMLVVSTQVFCDDRYLPASCQDLTLSTPLPWTDPALYAA